MSDTISTMRTDYCGELRLADQDRDGVHGEIIYPTVGMMLCNHPDFEYKQACFDAYNLWIAEYCAAHPDRLFGVGQTAMRSVEAGIADLEQIKRLGSVILGGVPEDALELAEGTVRIKDNPEAALPFMACGAIINANNAGLPEDLDVTLNCRYVYRPPFQVPDLERKFRTPAVWFVAPLGILVNGGLMWWLGRDNWIRLIGWLIVGLVIYFGYSRKHCITARLAREGSTAR